jgi:hypothetical protein
VDLHCQEEKTSQTTSLQKKKSETPNSRFSVEREREEKREERKKTWLLHVH